MTHPLLEKQAPKPHKLHPHQTALLFCSNLQPSPTKARLRSWLKLTGHTRTVREAVHVLDEPPRDQIAQGPAPRQGPPPRRPAQTGTDHAHLLQQAIGLETHLSF